jgi:GTP cyclohydrolase IB
VFDATQAKQDTVASVTLSVSLPPEKKGAHLSRFVEVAHTGEVTPTTVPGMLKSPQDRLGSSAARLQLSFPYFVRRSAPVTGASALTGYECGIAASARVIEAADAAASSPVFPVLKRADERHVTMYGYDHPVFVEDMARAVAQQLQADPRIACFTVEAASDESIHHHNAYARLSWPPERQTDGGQT